MITTLNQPTNAAILFKGIEKKICTTKEAMFVLSVGKDNFYKLSNDPKTKLKSSFLSGKWSLESVYQEAERLINFAG
jgi:hypothetical protein